MTGLMFFWFGLAIAVGIFASNRGRSVFGWFLLACIISPLLALILLAVTKNRSILSTDIPPTDETHVRCIQCAEFILPQAIKCKHCGAQVHPDTQFVQRITEQKIEGKSEESKNQLIGVLFIVALIVLATIFS